jgi:SOS regulatory protein LexA
MPRKMDMAAKLEQLRLFFRREGRVPSYAEMARLFGYRSKNAVYGPVRKLMATGHLRRGASGRIALGPRMKSGTALLGSIQAGFPSPAEEELLDTLSLDEFLVRRPEASYLLKVSGDSMTEAGIRPGDLALVEKGGTPRQNDIVIAQVDGEWTIKYFGKDREGVYLEPANAGYRRIRPLHSLVIGGIVRAVIRKYA